MLQGNTFTDLPFDIQNKIRITRLMLNWQDRLIDNMKDIIWYYWEEDFLFDKISGQTVTYLINCKSYDDYISGNITPCIRPDKITWYMKVGGEYTFCEICGRELIVPDEWCERCYDDVEEVYERCPKCKDCVLDPTGNCPLCGYRD